ncbi:MAG TPA: Ppx/GppA phosphatase family protein [Gaiellaceae bacterium]|nr:Ppx/GppA phosphatase family protein [Gaiellaceae bacterium]
MTRVAAVDLGTNSTRLLVADVVDGAVAEVHRETRITRLGDGVDARRRLLPVAIARVRNVLADFRREAERLGAERTLAVATSAVRDAENGEAFLGELEWSYGFATRLLSGDEEAAATLRGIHAGIELPAGAVVLDVGGGSTELIADGFAVSLDVGSVRLTERFLHADPPAPQELDDAAAQVRGLLPERAFPAAVGVAGTVTTLAAVDLGRYDPELVHGHRLPRGRVEALTALLASLPLDERRALPGMEPERAPVIVGGALVVREVLRRYGLDELEVSERDLLWGVALAAAELPSRTEGDAPPGAFTCC